MKKSDWNENDFIDIMHKAMRNKAYGLVDSLLSSVWLSTVGFVKKGVYRTQNGEVKLALTPDIDKKSILYSTPLHIADDEPRYDHLKIYTEMEDTFNAAGRMVKEGKKPCVLNMASGVEPGGNVETGGGAQEECLNRRSDYFRSLYAFSEAKGDLYDIPQKEQQYPMETNWGGIYSPGVTVFRTDGADGYALMKTPFKVDLVAVSALYNPEKVANQIVPELVEPTMNKIRTILRICYLNGHRELVLSAFGCGNYMNPAGHMAHLFKDVLEEDEFKNRFKEIDFAILPKDGNDNYEQFAAIFGQR